MPNLKEGDRVRIVTREPNEEDQKSGLYYRHFGGLTGSILKVYSKDEVSVEVEHESLSREARKRHDEVRDQMKTKWLDGLSEEGRNRLTERERDFNLRYVALVAMKDLERAGARAAAARPGETEPPPPRRTSAELDAAEEAEIERRQAAG